MVGRKVGQSGLGGATSRKPSHRASSKVSYSAEIAFSVSLSLCVCLSIRHGCKAPPGCASLRIQGANLMVTCGKWKGTETTKHPITSVGDPGAMRLSWEREAVRRGQSTNSSGSLCPAQAARTSSVLASSPVEGSWPRASLYFIYGS